jgi:hypothetical protein
MTVQTLKDMLSRRPFVPVRLTTSSCQTFEIKHPELALLTRTCLLIASEPSADGVPDDFRIISLLHVTSVEPIGAQAA